MAYTRFAQRAMGLACFLAPTLFLLAFLVYLPKLAPGYLFAPPEQAHASLNRLEFNFISYEANILLIPAFFALTYVVGQRAPRLAIACVVMGLYGLAVLITSANLDVNFSIATQAGTPVEWDFFQKNGPNALQLVMGLPIVLYFLANILLGVGVFRTGALPRWLGAVLIVAGLFQFDTMGPNMMRVPMLTGTLAAMGLLIVYGHVGLRLWRGEAETPIMRAERVMA